MSSPGLSPASAFPSSDFRPWYERLPRPPGESPFRIKGNAYRGLMRFVTKRVTGGMAGFAEHLKDPALVSFLEQPFLVGSYYDFLPIAAASASAASLCNHPLESFAHGQGRAQALYDSESVYRAFLQGRSFEEFGARFRPLCTRYYDFGEWEARMISPHAMRFIMRGIPAWSTPWFGPMQGGYLSGLVSVLGRDNPRVVVRSPRRDGVSGGLTTVTLELDAIVDA